MSTTTKNTLFDISSPDPDLQTEIFAKLCSVDILQANQVMVSYRRYDQNPFLEYGQGQYSILKALDDVEKSTNPIHISNGLFSEFFILMANLSALTESSTATDAYRYFVKKALELTYSVRVVHLHVRMQQPGLQIFRRLSLSQLHNSVDGNNPNQQWITFETPDVDVIAKRIIDLMRV